MDALEALGEHRLDAEQLRALGGPVARRARAVLLAREHDERHAFGRVLHRGVVDRRRRAVGQVHRDAALGAGREPVAQPDVRERAAHHHLVVAAPRAVRVEVARLDAVLEQPLPGRAVAADHAGRRDVVGGDAVAEQREHAGAVDVVRCGSVGAADALEERRPADVRGRRRPTRSGRRSARRARASARRRRGSSRSCSSNMLRSSTDPTTLAISASDGQRSRRYTGAPSRRDRADRASGRRPSCPRARTRRRAAATRGSSCGSRDGCGPRSCGCPRAPTPPRGRRRSIASRDLRRERPGVADARGAAVADDVEAERVQRLHAGRHVS